MMASGVEPFVVPAVVALMGAGIVARTLVALPRAVASSRWKETDGEVIAAELDPSPQGALAVSYRYSVDDRSFSGDRYYSADLPNPAGQLAMLEYYKHRPGQQVTVYYDPREPGRSALRKDALWPVIGGFCVGAALLLYAFVLVP